MQLYELTIQEAHAKLTAGEITSQELTRAALQRIQAVEPSVDAFISVDEGAAMQQAAACDQRIAAGDTTPLTGIPLGVKDLMCTKGMRTTCGSKILDNFVPPYDATVITRLKAAGAVIIGKLNMDEFAMGSSTEHSSLKVTRNPWDLDRIPGGSSGGSAAAVSADMCMGTLGSDTGGSIRQPASHCSVVGMKPTYGRVSRFGLVAFASSLDQIGPLTKCVYDNAVMMNAIAGYDPADSTSVPEPVPDYTAFLLPGLEDMTVGIPREYVALEGLDPDVSAAVENAKKVIQDRGATCVDVSLPNTEHVVAVYYVIAPCEASSNLARYDGVRYGLRDAESAGLMEMYKHTRTQGFGRKCSAGSLSAPTVSRPDTMTPITARLPR